ncbi:SH3 domain-containing protein [Gluconacetobacter azotocaptans]|uniref:SH3 domain-containing protein n=1 Tax=Gluconacetobacter azotocaptans TaxID=142834 RepID=A0A7W4JQ22_9PROT|nr:SH3 domain-containing protein [Gluconacetobacter azotocaptans]MBB2188845.1 SH3 domain-containing protein [Gluconacetobacter azotocaptans]MBM9401612.1 SH3 domain-containing protein [Gluconacetobacter azotocaptans]
MKHRLKAALTVLALGGMASPALAAPGVIVGGTDVFAGPSPNYPVVGSLPPGTPIDIFGCEPGWGWCDIADGPYRGWAPQDRIQVLYNGGAGPLATYGPMVGLPLAGFVFSNYWGAHYRGRPWFSDRDRWGGSGRGGPGRDGGNRPGRPPPFYGPDHGGGDREGSRPGGGFNAGGGQGGRDRGWHGGGPGGGGHGPGGGGPGGPGGGEHGGGGPGGGGHGGGGHGGGDHGGHSG